MSRIRAAIAGVGNCASALLQGIEHYRRLPKHAHEAWGLLHLELGGFRPEDVLVVAAFDVDRRKVGRPLHEAAFAPPNCTRVIAGEIAKSDVIVQMGPVLDGVAPHMGEHDEARSFRVATEDPVDVAEALRASGAEILLCYLPVGSTRAVHAPLRGSRSCCTVLLSGRRRLPRGWTASPRRLCISPAEVGGVIDIMIHADVRGRPQRQQEQ